MARGLMCSNMDYIIDNGFTLVDADGNVTTWGHWCTLTPCTLAHAPAPQLLHREPTNVNMNYYDFDSRGLNSLQILSWLQSACRLCDPSPSSKCVRCDRIRACCSAWRCVLVIQLLSNCIMKIVTLCACTSRRFSTWLRSTSESHVPSAVKASDALRAGMTSTFCLRR